MSENKNFYDIHCHAFNLSHAGLLAFLNRFLKKNAIPICYIINGNFFRILFKFINSLKPYIKYPLYIFLSYIFLVLIRQGMVSFDCKWHLLYNDIICCAVKLCPFIIIGVLIFAIFWFLKKRSPIKRIINLLSIIENDVSSMFLYMEEDILLMDEAFEIKIRRIKEGRIRERQKKDRCGDNFDNIDFVKNVKEEWEKKNSFEIKITNKKESLIYKYNKVILTPLLMDFGYKGFGGIKGIYYNSPPRKPIVEQVVDMYNGIKDYMKRSPFQLFEIYPFLGINTQNYELGKSQENDFLEKNSIHKMLNRYFGDYDGKYETFSEEYEKRFNPATRGKHSISIEDLDDLGSHFFAGIKLYPPLGFDPWPDPDKVALDKRERARAEFDKVNYLYQFCQEKGMPITVHCLNGGFVVTDDYFKNTDPKKWESVLSKYKNLKVNFAHCGIDETFSKDDLSQWTCTVSELIQKYENVYGDFAIVAKNKEFYDPFKQWICKENIKNRILFGSDFPMLLFNNDSYYEYLMNFFDSELDLEQFCHRNPGKFLFNI